MPEGQELLIILLVALVVLGPQRLPEVARKLGAWTAELRRAAREIRSGLEAEVREVQKVAKEVEAPIGEVRRTLRDTARLADGGEGMRWIGPRPAAGPTPEQAMADLAEIEETGRPATDLPDTPPAGKEA